MIKIRSPKIQTRPRRAAKKPKNGRKRRRPSLLDKIDNPGCVIAVNPPTNPFKRRRHHHNQPSNTANDDVNVESVSADNQSNDSVCTYNQPAPI